MASRSQWRTTGNGQQTSFPASVDQQYYEEPAQQDVAMDDVEAVGEDVDGEQPKRKVKPWEKLGPDGRPIKRKPNPARRNLLFRRALQPKSSIMCLNELKPGLKYVTEPVANIGNFCVSVEVNEQTFRGYGSTKDLAKQAAAEAALVSFVKPPAPKTPAGEGPKPEDDTTPWKTLASFAMFKLFSDWRDGRIGMCATPGQQGFATSMGMAQGAIGNGMGMANNMQAFGMITPQQPQQQAVKEEPVVSFSNINAHLNRSVHPTMVATTKPGSTEADVQGGATIPPASLKPIRESKLNTEHQQTKHPVMILHQLCPIIKYEAEPRVDAVSNVKVFTVSAYINEQQFAGEASTIKKAKIQLAKVALKGLYDIDNVYDGN